MNIFDNFGTFTALILTVAVFSGFFRQNPLYRFAESLFIGVSAGYFAVIWYFSIIKPTFQAALRGDLLILIPLIAGLLLFIPSNKAAVYSKFRFLPAAFIVIVTLAVNIPVYFNAFLKEMIRTSIIPLISFDSDGNFQLDVTINSLLSIMAVTSTMIFLVARHRNSNVLIHRTGEIGRFYVLVAIGAAFAYTLLSRLVLFMGKIEFIINAAKVRF
ncbi:hypothetical protein J6Z19_06900 [bacterium]|nr:hypothetical protein [bacterium]